MKAPRTPQLVALAALALLVLALVAGCGGSGDDEEETTTATAPVTGSGAVAFGFNEAVTEESLANPLLGQSGAEFVRISLNWAGVEAVEGQRNFAVPDVISESLEAVGLRPLWVVGSAPCWAAGVPCESQQPGLAPDPAHVSDYADFAAEVAQRYPDAVGLEIWNEPNIPNFWRPTPDAELYRQLLTETADAVHESGSEVPVVFSGPSPVTDEQAAEDPAKIGFVDFIEQVMSGPDAPDVDAVALHPYSLLQDGDPVAVSIGLYEEGRDAALAAAPDLPIWVTEVGLTTAGQFAITPEEQAAGLEEIVGTIADDGVPVISIHRFFDQTDPPLAFEAGFGVVEADGTTPKPSFCSAANAIGAECSP